jgi:hypothetical protein
MEQDVGVPVELIADQASETTGKNTEWMKEVRRLKIKMRWAEAGRKNQNTQAERKQHQWITDEKFSLSIGPDYSKNVLRKYQHNPYSRINTNLSHPAVKKELH